MSFLKSGSGRMTTAFRSQNGRRESGKSSGGKVTLSRGGGVVRATLVPDASGAAEWEVAFGPITGGLLDLTPLTLEALGNDQNYREVTQDQDGVTDFRFRYVLRGHARGYDNPETVAWSRSVAAPLVSVLGYLADERTSRPAIQLDQSRAVATCLKSADGDSSGGFILRLWETAGKSGPVRIGLTGYRKAIATDLLERDQKELPTVDRHIEAQVNPHGLCGIRLLP